MKKKLHKFHPSDCGAMTKLSCFYKQAKNQNKDVAVEASKRQKQYVKEVVSKMKTQQNNNNQTGINS